MVFKNVRYMSLIHTSNRLSSGDEIHISNIYLCIIILAIFLIKVEMSQSELWICILSPVGKVAVLLILIAFCR